MLYVAFVVLISCERHARRNKSVDTNNSDQAPTWEGGLSEAKCENKFLDREAPININLFIVFFGFFQTVASTLTVTFFYLNKGPLILRRGFDALANRQAASADSQGGPGDTPGPANDDGVGGEQGQAVPDAGAGLTTRVERGALRAAVFDTNSGNDGVGRFSKYGRLLYSAWFLLKDPFFLWCTLMLMPSHAHPRCSLLLCLPDTFYVCTVRVASCA